MLCYFAALAPCFVWYSCGPMMLDVLLKIKDEQDQSLTLRRSCRWGDGLEMGGTDLAEVLQHVSHSMHNTTSSSSSTSSG